MKLGFEAEFHTGVEALAAALHREGLSGSDHMHSYHCGCDECISWDWTYRVQSDSSCGGEVISSPFTDWRAMRRAIDKLATFAVDLDVEPGMDSGFHVHSSVERLDYYQRLECWVQFIRWEPALQLLAQGRFSDMRGFNNTARETFYRVFPDGDYNGIPCDPGESYDAFMDVGDRHCAINTRTRNHATFEFRLWNSTRAAWRMHMFAGLSHMFTQPAFVQKVAALDVSSDPEDDARKLRTAYAECAPRSTVPSYIDKQLACEPTNGPFMAPFVAVPAPEVPVRTDELTWETLGGIAPRYVRTPREVPPLLATEANWNDHRIGPDEWCTYDTPCRACRVSHPDYYRPTVSVGTDTVSTNW